LAGQRRRREPSPAASRQGIAQPRLVGARSGDRAACAGSLKESTPPVVVRHTPEDIVRKRSRPSRTVQAGGMGTGGVSPEPAPAATVMPVHYGTLRSRSTRDRQEELRDVCASWRQLRVRFSHRRLTVLLKRKGWRVNAERIHRPYVDEKLTIRDMRPEEGCKS